ncbi:gliding motility-associated C-terminal domain-containing protein [Phaeodactylibacter xiamenensis]|uniref:T9SS type B sorting domain-containing protein n=1 Tax=Phaeodactylibacter xiamenensis TaxID=1524460 RepID=UPI003BAD8716
MKGIPQQVCYRTALFIPLLLLGFLSCRGSAINSAGDLEFCGIISAGLGGVVCLDNDTPTNPDDDRLTLFLNPSGNNLGNGYTVAFASGSISPSTAVYGFPNGFVIDPNDPTVPTYQITLTDQNNPNCTFVLTFDNPCYSTCEVQQVEVLDVSCNNNNTPGLEEDDYITMEIIASGTDVSLQYNLIASPGLVLPGSGFYNTPELFQLTPGSAGSGPVSFILTDQGDLTCQYIFSIQDPGTCVSPCAITAPNLLGVQCDDMDTPNDPDDDELLITLNPFGISTSNAYTISGPGLTFLNTIGTYNNPTTFRMVNAAAAPPSFTLTLTDTQDPGCTTQVFVNNTAPCSTPLPCDITNATPGNISCTNGDIINFTLSPNSSTGSQYSLTIPNGTILGQNSGAFGTPVNFSFLPNTPQSSTYNVTIRDVNNSACTSTFAMDNPCDDCNLNGVNVLNVQCADNGTSTVQADDQMVITLQPSGTNLGSGYTIIANGQSTIPSGGNYNSPATFTLPAGTANSNAVNITIIDNNDPSCTYSFSQDGPGNCSDACTIFDQGLASIQCNNNGTISNVNDDFITFSLNVPAISTASGYNISAAGTTVTPSNGLYNTLQTFSLPIGSAGNGGTTITLTDQNNPGCTLSFFLFDPGDCSAVCNIEATEVNLFCQDGGTPGIFDDDTYRVEFEITNPTAASGSSWISDTPNGNTAGDYDDIASLGPFLISDGPIDVTFTDLVSPNCSVTVNLAPPPPCSDTCVIQSAGLTNLVCDNDILEFDLNPIGNALDTIYGVQIDNAMIVGSPVGYFGETTTFRFLPAEPLPDQYEIVITDSTVADCQFILTVDNVCKNCEITGLDIQHVTCNDAGTPSDPDDDFIEVELLVTSVYGTSYTVELANGNLLSGTGIYGAPSTFSMPGGSAGGGNVPLVVRDLSTPSCSQVFVIADPGTCSDECLLTEVNPTDIICDDNGTPGDPNDDRVTFSLMVDGLNTAGNYTLSSVNGEITPAQGTYGTTSTFSLPPGSTDVSISNVVITDNNDGNCSSSFNLSSPGSCSDSCALTVTLLDTYCLDNGTASDPTDDLFEFIVEVNNPVGTEGWFTVPPTGMENGEFGIPTVIGAYPISGGSINLAFIDENLTSCFSILTVAPPASCSDSCTLEAAVNVLACEDNSTPGTAQDDFFTAELTLSGVNNGSSFGISGLLDTTGLYDSTFVLGPLPANIPSTTITVFDLDQTDCTVDLEIFSPGTCSAGCSDSDTTLVFLESCNPLDTGISVEILANQLACDSFIITQTSLLPNDTTLLLSESCNPADTGTVAQILTNQFGCDSTVITTTTLLPGDSTMLFSQSCNPADTGTVVQALTNQFGCDSTVITTTTLLPGDSTMLFSQSCNPADTGTVAQILTNQFGCDSTVVTTTTLLPGDSTMLFSQSCNPADTGTVAQILTNQFGCDSTVVTTTTLLPSDSTMLFSQSCNPADTGTVAQILTNQFGCDSTVITTTTLLPSDSTMLFSQSCNPADTGTVLQTLTNQFGCDSTVITTTTLLPSDSTMLFSQSCNPADTGTVAQTLTNQFGCDSTVITTTTLLPSDSTMLFSQSCNPADTGTVLQTLTNQFGCDSTVITTTTLLPGDSTMLFSQSCNPADTGTVLQTLTNQFGCDSTVITTTTLLPGDSIFVSAVSCNPVDTGTTIEILNNQFGCDSVVTTLTTLAAQYEITNTLFSCNPQDTGSVSQTFTSQLGCDSVVVTQTLLAPSDTTLHFIESCNPVDTGTVAQILTNQFGCDSTVITTTTLLPGDSTMLFSQSCNPADTGTVVQTLTNQFGCDSTVITTTTLLPSDSTMLFSQSCNPADTGTVVQTLTNQFGCDSTVITTTTLLPSDSTMLFSQSCNPADTGTVVQTLTNQFGCDSTVVTTTTLLPGDSTMLFSQSCNPADTGTVVQTLTNQFGCDSTVITTTTLLPGYRTPVLLDICAGDSILFNGTYYSESQPNGIDTLNTVNGCDSILEVSINVLLQPEIRYFRDTLCADEVQEFFGTTYTIDQPTGQHIIPSIENGCDSVITNIELTFNLPEAELELTDPDCPDSTGHWSISRLSGGLPPYTYAIDGINFEIAEGLPLRGPIVPGNYVLILRDALGCEAQQPFEIQAMPPLTLDLGGEIEVRQGDTLTLTPELNFIPDSLIWSPAELLDCTGCLNPTLIPVNSTTITLRALMDAGCEVKDAVLIQVDKRVPVYAPNAFSPNGDNKNDYFTLFAKPNQVMEIDFLSIYDRWGNQVFEAKSFPVNEENLGWDGTSRGQLLNSGVYVYMAEVTLIDGRKLQMEGEVHLMR